MTFHVFIPVIVTLSLVTCLTPVLVTLQMDPVFSLSYQQVTQSTSGPYPLPTSGAVTNGNLATSSHRPQINIIIIKSFRKQDEYFPEKTVLVSYLDKKWLSPQLKNLNRRVKREYYKNRSSPKWRKLKKKFKVLKKKAVELFMYIFFCFIQLLL